jgi:glutamate carboxypeptidase
MPAAKNYLSFLRPRLPQMLENLRQLTLLESPSLDKAPADRCCEFLAGLWSQREVPVEIIPQKVRGNHLRIIYSPAATRPKSQFLVLGHYDTVYPVGTLARMPFRISAGKAYGPGVFDMKAGIVQALFALDTLQQSQISLTKRIVFFWTSDEEIGSASSRRLLETEARRSDAVFVLEPSLGPRGLLKTSRKGVGEAKLTVHGRASHAGLAPEKGINAIHELAAQVFRI